MDPLAGMDSSTDDESNASNASQTTEDDPQIPITNKQQLPPPSLSALAANAGVATLHPHPNPHHASILQNAATNTTAAITTQSVSGVPREKPNYQIRHTLRGHSQSISAVKFSPDGKLLASCGGFCAGSPISIRYPFQGLCLCLSTGAEKVVKIWSVETGEFIRNLVGHTQGLSDVAWSSDSIYLASASDDTTIRIWNVHSVSPFPRYSPPF